MCMLTFDYPQTYAVAGSAEEQVAQLRAYIWQLVDVLNQAGDGDEAGIGAADTAALRTELEKLQKALRDLEAKSGHGLPSGGTIGQTLTKLSDSDYDAGWRTPTGGASGGVTVDTEMSSTSTNSVQNKVVKSYVDTKVSGLQTASQVQDAISSAITGVYTPKGSIAFSSLPTAAAGNKGWVYNVADAFTTTAAFVEGAGHSYGAGTNVVCVDAGSGSYKWDVLAGIIDLTELTADEVQTLWDSI